MIHKLISLFAKKEKRKYAILGYSTINIGDDIQSLVVSKHITVSYIINRDDYNLVYDINGNRCKLKEPVYLIMNGWFMHNKNWRHGNKNLTFPIENELIQPIYISTCLSADVKELYNQKCLDHYKKFSPILARDNTTCSKLRELGVEADFFGCMTQTLLPEQIEELSAEFSSVKNKTIFVDCKRHFINHRSQNKIFIKHYDLNLEKLNPKERLQKAETLLGIYKSAAKIYTSRLHAFLPCRAMGLNVEYVGNINYRVKDLISYKPDRELMLKTFYNFIQK